MRGFSLFLSLMGKLIPRHTITHTHWAMASITKVTHTQSHIPDRLIPICRSHREGDDVFHLWLLGWQQRTLLCFWKHTHIFLFSLAQVRDREREHTWFPIAKRTRAFIIHYLSHSSSTIDPMWTCVNRWRKKNRVLCQEVSSHLVQVANWKKNEAFGMLFSEYIFW